MAVTSVTDHPDSGAGTKTTDERTYVRKQIVRTDSRNDGAAAVLVNLVGVKNRAGEREVEVARMAALTVVLANACHALAQHSDFGVVRKGLLPFAYITRRKVWRLCK